MKYCTDIFYQENEGAYHRRVSNGELRAILGWDLADRILQTAIDRVEAKSMPEVQAFFEHGGRQVILANNTNKGNVYIELVEVDD